MSLKKDVIGAEVQIGSNEAQKSLTDLAQKTATLANENDRLRISQAKLKAMGKEHSEEYKQITKAISENSKSIKDNNQQMDALRKTLGITEMTMKQLKVQSQTLRRELSGMTESANPERWAELNTQLIATERQMGLVKGRIGETRGFLGSFTNSLQSIPGPIGSVISGLMATGKAMWALVANPIGATIAAIVAGMMLLYKAFTATDEGAVKMEGTMKAISNVMDILIDRAMSYYKMLWSLVTFDWEGVKKNATDAFGGLASAIADATTAGWNYAKIMDDIADRESAAAPRMAKLRDEIEKLKTASKDSNKTALEKSNLIDEALKKEVQLNTLEKQFINERTAAELTNLASKINNNKLTMEQKEAQLKRWLEIDDIQLASEMEKDAAFAEFVNKNEEEFQSMQKRKADEYTKEAEFTQSIRRLEKSASAEKKALRDDEAAKVKEGQAKALEMLDSAHNDRMAKLVIQYEQQGWSDAKFKSEQLAAELAHLTLKKAMLEQFHQSTVQVEAQISEKRLAMQKDLNDVLAESEKQMLQSIDATNKIEMDQVEATIAAADKTIETLKDQKEKEKEIVEERKETYLQFAQTIGQTFGQLMNDNEATFGDYLKATLVMALDSLHQFFLIEKAKSIISGISGGPLKIALAVAKVAAMEIAYQAVRGALTKKGKKDGGYSGAGSDSEVDGFYHKNEFIASAPAVRNPTVKPVLDVIDMAQRTGTISSLNLGAISGRQSGGYASGVDSSLPGTATVSDSVLLRISEALAANERQMAKIERWQPTVYAADIKSRIDELANIETNRGLS
ncbi:MAG: hypothetical protein JZU49_01010 [Sulfuricurvum sp.]|nr:hypothetical protein [Sulfuricurvum sp.]